MSGIDRKPVSDRAFLARRFYDELSVWVFEHPDADELDSGERLVLLVCGWHGPEVKVGRRRICRATGLGNGSVDRALARLERRGLLVRTGTGPRGVTLRRIVVPGFNADLPTAGRATGADVPTAGTSRADHVPTVGTSTADVPTAGTSADVPTTCPPRAHDVPPGRPELEREPELPTSLPTSQVNAAREPAPAAEGRGGGDHP